VPLGIAVEEFTDGDGIQDLVKMCSEADRELLSKYELRPLYDKRQAHEENNKVQHRNSGKKSMVDPQFGFSSSRLVKFKDGHDYYIFCQ
jgi:hypothetical protein